MLKLIAKLFGTKSEKDIKRIMPLVEKTKQEGERIKNLSNDGLRDETKKIQEQINQELKGIDASQGVWFIFVNAIHADPMKLENRAHPFTVAHRQIIVYRHKVDAAFCQRV